MTSINVYLCLTICCDDGDNAHSRNESLLCEKLPVNFSLLREASGMQLCESLY